MLVKAPVKVWAATVPVVPRNEAEPVPAPPVKVCAGTVPATPEKTDCPVGHEITPAGMIVVVPVT